MRHLLSIALASVLAAGCSESGLPSVTADSGAAPGLSDVELLWPVAPGVSSFVTQSAARSDQPYPCGSGVNSQHILHGHDGDNHTYEHSLDIVARHQPTTSQEPTFEFEGRGTDIVAVADGVVVAVSASQSECVRDQGAGNFVILEHPQLQVDGAPVLSAYMHLNSSAAIEDAQECRLNPAPILENGFQAPAIGTVVKAGEKIGELGNTGNSTGTHLHFQFASSCTLAPTDAVDCSALSVLDIAPRGFSNLSVSRDDSCPSLPAVGGPVSAPLSPETYLRDGSYVIGQRRATASLQHIAAR